MLACGDNGRDSGFDSGSDFEPYLFEKRGGGSNRCLFYRVCRGQFCISGKKAKHVYSEHEENGKESLDDDLKDGINLTTGLENLENYGNRILIDMARVYRRSSLVEKIKGIV